MKKKIGVFCLVCALFLIVSGCGKKHTDPEGGSGLATRVDIHCVSRGETVSRFYSQPAKIEAVLIYLRLLEPIGPVQLPQTADFGDYYEIVVYLSDGSRRVHRQCADCYATTEQGWWGIIDRRYGQQLPRLIRHIPSDAELANFDKSRELSYANFSS